MKIACADDSRNFGTFVASTTNPEAQYFGVGKITQDQLESYAQRKNITLQEAEKWLRPNLK